MTQRRFSRQVFRWEDPPGYLRESAYKTALVKLRDLPGEWACILESEGDHTAHTTAQYLRTAPSVIREGAYEFAARKIGPGVGAVYARYLGPSDESARRAERQQDFAEAKSPDALPARALTVEQRTANTDSSPPVTRTDPSEFPTWACKIEGCDGRAYARTGLYAYLCGEHTYQAQERRQGVR
jgi:hypothetical protein